MRWTGLGACPAPFLGNLCPRVCSSQPAPKMLPDTWESNDGQKGIFSRYPSYSTPCLSETSGLRTRDSKNDLGRLIQADRDTFGPIRIGAKRVCAEVVLPSRKTGECEVAIRVGTSGVRGVPVRC